VAAAIAFARHDMPYDRVDQGDFPGLRKSRHEGTLFEAEARLMSDGRQF
jgi:hypothetical protein